MWMMLQALTLTAGLSTSVNLGEVGPAPSLGLIAHAPHVESRSWLDLSRKHETGQGFLLGQTLLGVAGPLVGGVDVRYRSGGAWHKNVLWGVVGVQGHVAGGLLRLAYRPELTHTNELHMLDGFWRVPISQRFSLELRPTLVRYQQKAGAGLWTKAAYGFSSEVAFSTRLGPL